MRRKTVVQHTTEDGLKVKLTIETADNGNLTFGEHKKLQDELVDAAVFAIRAAPFVGSPPISRMKIN